MKGDRRWLFVATICLGSFLLFLVQPMVARLALPRLGGAPNVWNSAMLVYQALLLAGYAYAHLIGRLAVRAQFIVHLTLFALAALSLPIALSNLSDFGSGFEVLWVPALLFATIGPVFFVVSAQAPLVQRWYALSSGARDPYPLYAASNLGSFAGLISYPLVIEPNLALGTQSSVWGVGYAVLAGFVIVLAALRWGANGKVQPSTGPERTDGDVVGWSRIGTWLILAAIPSGLMLSTTTHLTTDIFAMPLLWVIPLGLYLLSFVPAFAEDRRAARLISLVAPIALFLIGGLAMFTGSGGGLGLATGSVILLFILAVTLHAKLFDLRPDPQHLTLFYLVMSAGGALGGLFTALIAPVVFDWVWEHPLLILLAAIILPLGGLADWPRKFAEVERRRLFILVFALLAGVGLAAALQLASLEEMTAVVWIITFAIMGLAWLVSFNRLAFVLMLLLLMFGRGGAAHISDYTFGERTRSYFGVYTVAEIEDAGLRRLKHGTTIHGFQFLDSEKAREPTSYYGRSSGVGLVLSNANALFGPGVEVGAIGLGAGTIACYREPDQTYRYYEIDPVVLEIAQEGGFTFLSECSPNSETVIGDARLALEGEEPAQFDILVVDAFSSDAIPLHLLTKEALNTYMRSVKSGGVVMIHISNRYIDLEPVLAAAVSNAGWHGVILRDTISETAGLTDSIWVAVAEDADVIERLAKSSEDSKWKELANPANEVWTDDYASTMPHLRWRSFLWKGE